MMSHLSNAQRSKLDEVGAFIMQEDVVYMCPMCVCNRSFLKCNLILSQGVTAGPTLGLIPSIHLQRHCQSGNATSQRDTAAIEKGGEEAGAEVDREGRKKEKREGLTEEEEGIERELSGKSIQ